MKTKKNISNKNYLKAKGKKKHEGKLIDYSQILVSKKNAANQFGKKRKMRIRHVCVSIT